MTGVTLRRFPLTSRGQASASADVGPSGAGHSFALSGVHDAFALDSTSLAACNYSG